MTSGADPRRVLCAFALICVACICTAAVPSAAPAAPAAAAAPRLTTVKTLEVGVLKQINQLRRRQGLVALRLAVPLSAAAAGHSRAMLTRGFFAHESADGTSFFQRVRRYYGPQGYGTWAIGENLLWSSPDIGPARAVQVWLASPGHRENLLAARWREIGLSAMHSTAAPGTFNGAAATVLTADFGVRR